jgi:hypothetical protein
MKLSKRQVEILSHELEILHKSISEHGYSLREIEKTVTRLEKDKIDKVDSLLRIAMKIMQIISWNDYCDIYKYSLKVGTSADCHGIYAVWLSMIELYWLDIREMTLDERKQVFEDAEKINEAFLEVSPENSGGALGFGMLYYKFSPEKPDYEKAKFWFQKSQEWSEEDEDTDALNSALVYLAYCDFKMQNWSGCLENFGKVSPEGLVEEADEGDYEPEYAKSFADEMKRQCKLNLEAIQQNQ